MILDRSIVIFDLDGVIVDSEKLHYEAYRLASCKYGFDLTEDVYNQHMRSRERKIGIVSAFDVNDKMVKAIGAEKDLQFSKMIEAGGIIVFDDASKLLKDLKIKGIRMAVGTASKIGDKVIEKMNLSEFFEVIVTSRDVSKNKPDPAIYLKAMEKLKVSSEVCYIVEDSESGTIAGLKAGAQVIFVKRDGAPSLPKELLENPRVQKINNLEEINEIIL